MLNDMSSMTENKLSNRHQIMPTSTKKTHTTQRGVSGMRRRPRNFHILIIVLQGYYRDATAEARGAETFKD